jgi:hypothetical protein
MSQAWPSAGLLSLLASAGATMLATLTGSALAARPVAMATARRDR